MANRNDDCLSVNSSDFERIPDTPLEREEDEDDLNGGQKTPTGFTASEFGDDAGRNGTQSAEPASIDPVVMALMKKVNILVVQMEGMSKKMDALGQQNSELLVRVDDLGKENSELRTHVAEFKHHKEHENAKIVVVDNSKGAQWDTTTSFLAITNLTVENGNGKGVSICSTRGFSTVPVFMDSIIYSINYYEVTIDAMSGSIHVGVVPEDFRMDGWIGHKSRHSFAIIQNGTLSESGKMEYDYGYGPGGFSVDDTVGCGIMVGSKTALAGAVDCNHCLEKSRWLFFTKNGKIWGTPIALPLDVPSTLFPAVSLDKECKVTANFGNKPFKYVPPDGSLSCADGLFHCGQLNNDLEKVRVEHEKKMANMLPWKHYYYHTHFDWKKCGKCCYCKNL